jgi:hypothetical protein
VGTHQKSFDAQQGSTAGARVRLNSEAKAWQVSTAGGDVCPSTETTAASVLLGDREDSPKAVQAEEKRPAVRETAEEKCIMQACGKVHQLRHCKTFSGLPLEERCDLVERHDLCKACLGLCGQATARK